MNRILLSLLILFFLSKICLKAQDIHHSQFYTSPLNVNPALTGVFNGDQRLALNYRRQWFVEDIVRYMTVTGSFDIKFYPKKWKTKGNWNAGILFNYDQAGDSHLGLANLGLSVSYTYPLNTTNLITLGGLIGYSQRRFNKDDLTWGKQWDGDHFNPSIDPEEDFGKTSNSFMDLSGGVNYRWQKSQRTKIDFGVGIFHLNQPDQKFFNKTVSIKLPIRFNINLTPSFKLTESIDLLLHAQYQNQSPYQETIAGGYVKFYLNQHRGKELNLLLGISDRFDDPIDPKINLVNDAIIPKIAVEWTNWYVGFSYDITTSDFKPYTDQRSGPEFSLVHIITKAHPLTVLKSCPIF
jgi:type IX secretion system PorP/SprF family membrane protein